jgi:hypothetical protein
MNQAAALAAVAMVEEMQNHQTVLSSFQFKRTSDVIQVYNENSYFMAEYSERTGTVKWQRVLIASQRELIERWLRERYPASTMVTASARASAAAKVAAPAPAPVKAAAVQAKRQPSARSTGRRRA